MIRSVILLAAACAMIGWFLKGDLGDYRRFKAVSDTMARQRRYRLWIAKAVIAFALPAIIGLAVLGRLDAVVTIPAEFAPLQVLLPALDADDRGFLLGLFGGGVAGGLALGALLAVRRSRGAPLRTLGHVGALLPRNRAERWHGAAVALTAGFTEELTFRLFLPLLIVGVTGQPLLAFGMATMLFGAMHRYQGWVGVVSTTLVGALLAVVYLCTATLWIAMAVHALIDLNGLVLRPLLTHRMRAP